MRGPTPTQFTVIPNRLSYWLNNQYGDCVTAEEAFAKACYQPEILIQDATVYEWARSHGWLNGADLLEVLQAMEEKGFSQDGKHYNDGHALAVDYTNPTLLCNAIATGPVKLGVAAGQLENAVGGSNGWIGVGWRPDHNEDHSVALCGFGPMAWLAAQLGVALPPGVDPATLGYHLFTWNTIGIVDHASMVAITGEAWVRNPTTIIDPPPTPPPPPPPPPPLPPLPVPPSGSYVVSLTAKIGPISIPITGTVGPSGGWLTPLGLQFAGVALPDALPPWMLRLLQALCAEAPLLPPPYNALAMLACRLVPPADGLGGAKLPTCNPTIA